MHRGMVLPATIALLLATGCSSDGKLEIRALAPTPSATAMPLPQRIAEANAQLALGNAALALESYRRAAREQPGSVDAFLGMAACYDLMHRYDLSRRNYEAALALAPTSTAILSRFAASLEQQGAREDAADVRREVAERLARTDASATAEGLSPSTPPASSVSALPLATDPVAPAAVVTVSLSPPEPAPAMASGPRIERLSLGEVALVTASGPRWKSPAAQVTERARGQATLRAAPAAAPIRLLNAARQQGLAARTRALLVQRGWRRMVIGDSQSVRSSSIIFYPAARRATAERLAAQFGYPLAAKPSGRDIVMLLGRDATGPRRGREP